jgi:hypothetical protein
MHASIYASKTAPLPEAEATFWAVESHPDAMVAALTIFRVNLSCKFIKDADGMG